MRAKSLPFLAVDLVGERGKRICHLDNQWASIAESYRLRSHLQQHRGAAGVAGQRCGNMAFDRQFQPRRLSGPFLLAIRRLAAQKAAHDIPNFRVATLASTARLTR
jgi:hypothetical protein